MLNKKKRLNKRKHGFALALSFGLLMLGAKVFSQTAPPPPTPPPGEVLKSINPFKKKTKTPSKKNTGKAAAPTPGTPPAPGTPPPPPPNPLDLLKKKPVTPPGK